MIRIEALWLSTEPMDMRARVTSPTADGRD